MTRVTDEPLIVLHTRPYRETSLLLSGFSLHEGRVSLLGRGARGRSRRGRELQPLVSLRVGWTGRSGLKNLSGYELTAQPRLSGQSLVAGLYLAELVTRLFPEHEAHPKVFAALAWALDALQRELEPVLRIFERLLLDELGYGLDFSRDATGAMLAEQTLYRFDPAAGFFPTTSPKGYAGAVLLALGRDDYEEAAQRLAAKRIFRQALAPHLGPKPLMSRKLIYRRRA